MTDLQTRFAQPTQTEDAAVNLAGQATLAGLRLAVADGRKGQTEQVANDISVVSKYYDTKLGTYVNKVFKTPRAPVTACAKPAASSGMMGGK